MESASKHPDKALSSARVRNVSKPGRYADGNGLYLVVDPSGAKRWILRTVIKRKRSDIGLGSLSLVGLAEARDEASRLRKIARRGGDPLAERRAARRVIPTFNAAARTVFDAHKESWKNAKHAAQWIRTLEEYAVPVFGQKTVDQIEPADVLKCLNAIWLEKPETARRVLQRIRTVMDWAKASGFRSGDNPIDGVLKVLPKHRDNATHHAALPYAAVPQFIKRLRGADAGASVKLAFELMILTATRTSEVLNAAWTEVDTANATWTIPPARMKAEREHKIPLPARCLSILAEARKLSGSSSYVFPGRSTDKPLSNMVFLMTLRRMKVDATAHGFRSSFRDWASEQTNFPRDVCEAALAHTLKDKTEAAYKRTDLFERRRDLMAAWAKFCVKTK